MPINPTYPGVYVQELESPSHTIIGVRTSVTAFIGLADIGPKDKAIMIHSFEDYARNFGGLSKESNMSYAVFQYYLNGGQDAIILALDDDPKKVVFSQRINGTNVYIDPVQQADPSLSSGQNLILFEAKDPGNSGKDISIYIERNTLNQDKVLYNLYVKENIYKYLSKNSNDRIYTDNDARATKNNKELLSKSKWLKNSLTLESFMNVSFLPDDSRYIKTILEDSSYIRIFNSLPSETFISTNLDSLPGLYHFTYLLEKNKDGEYIVKTEENNNKKKIVDPSSVESIEITEPTVPPTTVTVNVLKISIPEVDLKGAVVNEDTLIKRMIPTEQKDIENKKGIYALDDVDIFNILCIPPLKSDEIKLEWYVKALSHLDNKKRRAIILVDPPTNWRLKSDPIDDSKGIDIPANSGIRHKNAAIFFPRIKASDPLQEGRIREFVPCGAIAGVIARTDGERGVWKAPAGMQAQISGITDLAVKLTDDENGDLNPLGINCMRVKPPFGIVVWGSRTLRGADQLTDQWKYLPVRRLALYIEESLYRGTQWVVFEPNDEPLWAQIRLNVGAFMQDLFIKGAFQGSNPKEAYLVKCDHDTTTQTDIDRGIVNIVVGFQPLKPAEFVILQIKQLAGQQNVTG